MMRPTTEDALAHCVAEASGPLRIIGAGTRDIGRPVEGAEISTAGLSGIELYEPGALTIVARAGTPVAELEAALDAENQRFAFEPMDHRGLLGTDGAPTIGGVVAGNVSGPRRVAVGACRDHMLGVRYVDGSGTIVKNGGRVMKNVTGYDLVKLMAGSWGTLGVMSEVSLKVLPKVEATASLAVSGLDDAQAVAAMSACLGSPFEVTGAAHMQGVTYIRIEGFEASVAYRAAELTKVLAPYGTAEVAMGAAAEALWLDVRDVRPMQSTPGDIWKLSVRPSDAPGIVARAGAQSVMYDWGGGLIWVEVAPGTDLRAVLGTFSGHATLIRASEDLRRMIPVFQPEPAGLAAITSGLRAKFDPRGILNSGLMG